MISFLWLMVASLFYAAGEYYSKRWADHGGWYNIAMLFVTYMVGVALWLPALKITKTLAVTGMLWLMLAILTATLLGIFMFEEKLTACQWTGVAMAIIACVLLTKW
jgi:drug/metabolite transporter (DMT)-like permease